MILEMVAAGLEAQRKSSVWHYAHVAAALRSVHIATVATHCCLTNNTGAAPA
jgi:hypothetical protein